MRRRAADLLQKIAELREVAAQAALQKARGDHRRAVTARAAAEKAIGAHQSAVARELGRQMKSMRGGVSAAAIYRLKALAIQADNRARTLAEDLTKMRGHEAAAEARVPERAKALARQSAALFKATRLRDSLGKAERKRRERRREEAEDPWTSRSGSLVTTDSAPAGKPGGR